MKVRNLLVTALWLSLIPMGAFADNPAPASEAVRQGMQMLSYKIMVRWLAPCDLKDDKNSVVVMKFMISPDGMLKGEPEWDVPREDKTWQLASERAIAAIKKAQPYGNLPPELYNMPIKMTFDARKACQAQ